MRQIQTWQEVYSLDKKLGWAVVYGNCRVRLSDCGGFWVADGFRRDKDSKQFFMNNRNYNLEAVFSGTESHDRASEISGDWFLVVRGCL